MSLFNTFADDRGKPLPTRPGSAITRPGTSGGRRNLAQAGSTANQGPELNQSTSSMLRSELGNDELLRIMTADKMQLENEAILCAEKGDLPGIQRAIENGVDIVSCRGLHGYTALHHACNRAHALVVSELIRLNMPIDIRNDSGETPLHLAVYAGNILVVDQLLDKGADINAVNADKETCLFYAARRRQPAIIRLLLQRGADASLEDALGDTAVDQATDPNSIRAFKTKTLRDQNDNNTSSSCVCGGASGNEHQSLTHAALNYSVLLKIYSYLNVMDVLRCACVSSKWHRVSEYEEVWKALGVRRWELALQSSLGFAPAPTASFFRPKRISSKGGGGSGGGGSDGGSDNSSRENSSSRLLVTYVGAGKGSTGGIGLENGGEGASCKKRNSVKTGVVRSGSFKG